MQSADAGEVSENRRDVGLDEETSGEGVCGD